MCVCFFLLVALAESEGADDWDDEMEAAYQVEKRVAFEVGN